VRKVLIRWLPGDSQLRHHVFLHVLRVLLFRTTFLRDVEQALRRHHKWEMTDEEAEFLLRVSFERALLRELFDGRWWRQIKPRQRVPHIPDRKSIVTGDSTFANAAYSFVLGSWFIEKE